MGDDKYMTAAVAVSRFLGSVSSEAQAVTARIIHHGTRFGALARRPNAAQFDLVAREAAADLESFAQALEGLMPTYRRNLELLTEGYEEKLKALDPDIEAGARELADMRRAAGSLAETATSVKGKVVILRSAIQATRDGDAHPRTTQAAHRVIKAVDELLSAYEDLETFALRVGFAAAPRTQEE